MDEYILIDELRNGRMLLQTPEGDLIVGRPVRQVASPKSCPNRKCAGGWLPDHLEHGWRICPACKTQWQA